LEHLGTADRIVVNQETTTIIGRHGSKDGISARVDVIESQLSEDRFKNENWRLNKRIATLTGGVGVIYVGGNSESEMRDSYFRIEDALAATKAALESGYVAGGGVAYLRASMDSYQVIENRDQQLGYESVLNALKQPLKKIVENCGEEGSVAIDRVMKSKNANYGYDALEGEYGDMIRKGIIDPIKVVKTAIKNAASVAGMIITTNCVISEIKK